MFDYQHYVPMLKGKLGEFGALQQLAVDEKKLITPLIDVPPVPWDFVNDRPAKLIDKHLIDIVQRTAKAWDDTHHVFVDLYYIEPGDRTKEGHHPVEWFFDLLQEQGMLGIPVTGLDRDSPYQSAVRKVIRTGKQGACIRLALEDIEDSATMNAGINHLLNLWHISPHECDIIFDFRDISGHNLTDVAALARHGINELANVSKFRTMTIASSNFPVNLSGIPSNGMSPVPRTEFSLWRALLSERKKLRRRPSFGDYAIAHPDLPDLDLRTMRMSANLRYTTESDWLVFKARDAKRYGYDQFNDLCKELVNRDEFSGEEYSWGDSYIQRCANGIDGPGNASSWRKAGTSHHLVLVSQQVAMPGVP